MGGLQFLAALISDKQNSIRLYKRVMALMFDLALNDENIFEENRTMVRKTLGEQMGILERLIELLTDEGELENN